MKLLAEYSRHYDNPVRIVQFGEGNFLRAFWGKAVHELNSAKKFEGQICIVQPIPHGRTAELAGQNYLYTVCLQDADTEEITLVESVKSGINPYEDYDSYLALAVHPDLRIMISNTTEAGIVLDEKDSVTMRPPKSFPGKLLAFLYERYKAFSGRAGSGLLLFPCELIERNGDTLKKVLLKLAAAQGLEAEFAAWIEEENVFFNTLVDCIVTGYPHNEADVFAQRLGYEDAMLVKAEAYQLLVIEGDDSYRHEFPISEAKMHVVWTDDLAYYRDIKVRIMNGFQTMLSHCGFLAGIRTEREALNHPVIGTFMVQGLYGRIVPSLAFDEKDKADFARIMLERLDNPHIEHVLRDINLNSFTKFQTRIQPSLDYWLEQGESPDFLLFSLAAVLAFYQVTDCREGSYTASCCGLSYSVFDSLQNLEGLYGHKKKALEENSTMYQYCCSIIDDASLWVKPMAVSREDIAKVADFMEKIEIQGVIRTVSDAFPV